MVYVLSGVSSTSLRYSNCSHAWQGHASKRRPLQLFALALSGSRALVSGLAQSTDLRIRSASALTVRLTTAGRGCERGGTTFAL
jgi:hypothetical protein